ncbi:MAG: APC family permease [Halothiobacillus sp.]
MDQLATQLEKNALGLTESTIMGVAGTAPVFSISATSATLMASVGALAPASLLYCGLIMLGVTFAYMHLNRLETNAGASYAWVSAIFGRTLGFLAGWALLVASAVFMVSGTVPAADATLALIAPAYVNNTAVVSLVASFWLILVSAVIIKGVKLTSYVQVVLTVIEFAIVLIILVAALWQYAHHPAHTLHWSDFAITQFNPHLFATGALTALFFYWGWDVTANLNEETRNGGLVAGLGSLFAMLIIMVLFVLFAVVTLMVLSDSEIQSANTNVVLAIAEKIFPAPWSYLAVLAVMFSTLGTLETSIVQFTRTMFAQARDGMLNPRYAKLHSAWHTPWIATLVIAGFGLVLLIGAAGVPTVNEIIQDSVDTIGFQASFYYGLACFASAWMIWRSQNKTPIKVMLFLLWPLGSGLFLWVIGIISLPSFNLTGKIFAVGGVLIGLLPFWLNRHHRRKLVGAENMRLL